jgi:hypothetical protein
VDDRRGEGERPAPSHARSRRRDGEARPLLPAPPAVTSSSAGLVPGDLMQWWAWPRRSSRAQGGPVVHIRRRGRGAARRPYPSPRRIREQHPDHQVPGRCAGASGPRAAPRRRADMAGPRSAVRGGRCATCSCGGGRVHASLRLLIGGDPGRPFRRCCTGSCPPAGLPVQPAPDEVECVAPRGRQPRAPGPSWTSGDYEAWATGVRAGRCAPRG